MQFNVPPSPEYRCANPPVEVYDARQLQSSARSEADFLEEHGFVLLRHASAVKNWAQDVGAIYRDEINTIITERLLPGRRVRVQQSIRVVRRGEQGRFYAEGVHSDGPLTVDAYASNLRAMVSEEGARAWQQTLASDKVAGFVLMNFWRPIEMSEPLRHMPLALCDPNSIEPSDLIPNTISNIAPEGRLTEHLALRYNPSQQWYYYPDMRCDEVIAFKLYEYLKGDPDRPLQNVFHSAFRDPDAPEGCEPRKSCEHRAAVTVFKD